MQLSSVVVVFACVAFTLASPGPRITSYSATVKQVIGNVTSVFNEYFDNDNLRNRVDDLDDAFSTIESQSDNIYVNFTTSVCYTECFKGQFCPHVCNNECGIGVDSLFENLIAASLQGSCTPTGDRWELNSTFFSTNQVWCVTNTSIPISYALYNASNNVLLYYSQYSNFVNGLPDESHYDVPSYCPCTIDDSGSECSESSESNSSDNESNESNSSDNDSSEGSGNSDGSNESNSDSNDSGEIVVF